MSERPYTYNPRWDSGPNAWAGPLTGFEHAIIGWIVAWGLIIGIAVIGRWIM